MQFFNILLAYNLIFILVVAVGYAYWQEEYTLVMMNDENRSINELRWVLIN